MTGVLLLVGLAGSWWWLFILKPVVDERRPFVGTWRLESPSPGFPARPELVVERDLMLDGTIIERVCVSQTGAIDYEQPSPCRWYVSNGRIQEVIGGNPLLDMLRAGSGAHVLSDQPVTWEGPDRFRLEGTPATRKTMVWSRCERAGRR
jgi:hypothetical protein